jgi:hypothetical protein
VNSKRERWPSSWDGARANGGVFDHGDLIAAVNRLNDVLATLLHRVGNDRIVGVPVTVIAVGV